MIDAFFYGMFATYIVSGAAVLGMAIYQGNKEIRASDIGLVVGTILVWPLFVNYLFKRL